MNDGSTTRGWVPVRPEDAPPPAGAYSPAVRAGDLVVISGQVPRDPRTGSVIGEDVREQTRAVLANARAALEAAGASLSDVIAVTAYLASMDDWKAFDEVYREVMPQPWPTRTTVGAELRGFLVEITMTAFAPRR